MTRRASNPWVSHDCAPQRTVGSIVIARRPPAPEAQRPRGVVEALADGLSAVLAEPLLMVVPLLLDLYYWLGWRVRLDGLAAWIAERSLPGDVSLARPAGHLATWDVLSVPAMLVGALLSGGGSFDVYRFEAKPSLVVHSAALGILVFAGAVVAAALVLAVFSVPLVNAMLPRPQSVRAMVDEIGAAWIRLIGLLAVAAGFAALLLLPVVVGWYAFRNSSVDAGDVAIGIGSLIAFMLLTALWFAPEAVLVLGAGPFRAVGLSLGLLRRFFWQSVGFIGAAMLIDAGMTAATQAMSSKAPGLLLGAIINAFFVAGSAAASIRFFADRAMSGNAATVAIGAVGRAAVKE